MNAEDSLSIDVVDATQSAASAEPQSDPQQQHDSNDTAVVVVAQTPASAIAIESSETGAYTFDRPTEDASIVEVKETLELSSANEAVPCGTAAENAQSTLLLGEGSQDLLPLPPTTAANVEEELTSAEVVPIDDATDDADGLLGAVIQNKYSATSEWIESLPESSATQPIVDVEPHCGEEASGTSTRGRRGKRAREGQSQPSGTPTDTGDGGGTLRQRRAREKAAEAELQTAFKHSQRALRKQAKSVNMKDVFARTFTLPSPLPLSDVNANAAATFPSAPLSGESASLSRTASGGVFSPSSSSFRFGQSVFSPAGAMSPTTPSNSSAWSPCVVGELTNQFLANVKHQRRQKFEQFVSRELTQSQALSQTHSQTRHPHLRVDGAEEEASRQHGRGSETAMRNATASTFSSAVDELVIGEDDNEAANWMPADVSSPASQHGGEQGMLRDVRGINANHNNSDVALLGASSSDGELRRNNSTSPTPVSDSRKAEELASQQQQQQQQVVQSLSRKHEIWKLKQRQLKAQQQVDMDDKAKAKAKQRSSTASLLSVSSTTSTTTTTITTASQHRGSTADTTIDTASTASFSSLQHSSSGFLRTTQISSPNTTTRSVHKANLSADAISMIRRINSFDNTSTQRVVVFGTAASAAAAKQSKEEDTQ